MSLNHVTTLMILSGIVRGVRERMSAVTEEDHGSVSSCLNQLGITYIERRVCTNSVNSDEDVPLKQIKLSFIEARVLI